MFFRKFFAIIYRDALEALSYKTAFFTDLLAMTAQLLIFFFVGRMIGPQAAPFLSEYGGEYFPFVLIGIAVAGFCMAGTNSFTGTIMKEQGDGTLEAIFVTPTSLGVFMFTGFIRTFVSSSCRVFVFLLMGLLFFKIRLPMVNIPVFLLLLVLSMVVFGSFGLFSGGALLVLKRGDPFTHLFNAASRFLAGVYFPVTLLPLWLQKVSLWMPMTYALQAIRKAVLIGASVHDLQAEMITLALFSAVLFFCGIAFFNWCFEKARKEGSLAFR